MTIYVNNAFSQKMLSDDCRVDFERISETTFMQEAHKPNVVSCIGHEDTAKLFNLAFNRITIKLNKGDVVFVCELNIGDGGRLPSGITDISDLPNDFIFKFWKITVL